MTPKEKAIELVDKYNKHEYLFWDISYRQAQDCALIAVDEIINTLNMDIRDLDVRGSVLLDLISYWREVKQEIEAI